MIDFTKLAFLSNNKIEMVLEKGTFQLSVTGVNTTFDKIPHNYERAPLVDAIVSVDNISYYPLPYPLPTDSTSSSPEVSVFSDDDFIYFASQQFAVANRTIYFKYSVYHRDL